MRRLICNLLIITLVAVLTGKGQPCDRDVSSILETLYGRIGISRDDNERLRINDSVMLILDSYSTSDTVIRHRFDNLRFLGQITSPDRKLKIINWNVNLHDGTSNYYCYIIRNEGRGQKNRTYKLKSIDRPDTIRTDISYSINNWYGALYYDIRPFKSGRETHYVVLGIDYYSLYLTRKIIDILSFTPEGELVFGKNCFINDDKIRSREVLEYSSDGVVTLRFNTGRSVVFDHLVPLSPDKKNNREYYGAEYSYDAYVFKNGMWRFFSDFDVKNKKQEHNYRQPL